MPPPATPPPARPAPAERRGRGGVITLVAVVGVVLLLGVVAGILAATGAFSSGSKTEAATTAGGGLGPPSTVDTTPTTSTRSAAVSGADVRAVLRRYESAYTAHDANGLRTLFTPTFTRKNGSAPAKGIGGAMAEYRAQFKQFPNSVYQLNIVDVKPGPNDASAAALYKIDNAGAAPSQGSIGFHMSRVGDAVKIDAIAIKAG